MSGHHRDGAELAHGPGIAEQDPVDQSQGDVGQGDPGEDLKTPSAQGDGRRLLVHAKSLHEGDQLPRDERQGDKDGR